MIALIIFGTGILLGMVIGYWLTPKNNDNDTEIDTYNKDKWQ